MSNEIESLESMVQKPKKSKKPSNAALWFAYAFFNIVILTFDTVAAGTVYAITNNWGYTILTFLAGFLPLMLHEFLFLRAFASQWQRWLAVFGAVSAVLTVGAVALLSAGVNLAIAGGYEIASSVSEIAILIVIVGSALLHGILAAVYFYIDEGIRATHTEAETVAFYDARLKNIKRAESLLDEADKARQKKAEIVTKHGGKDGKAALDYLLNLLNDDDGDGIPNMFDRVDNRQPNPQPYSPPKSTVQSSPQNNSSSHSAPSRPQIAQKPAQGQEQGMTLEQFLSSINMNKAQVEEMMKQYGLYGETETREALRAAGLWPEGLSNNRFKKLFYEMFPERIPNPTNAAIQSNGRR